MSQLSATILQVKNRQSEDVSSMQMYIKSYFPNTAQALKIIDSENLRPKRRKGFNLFARRSVKNGDIYYANVTYQGKRIKFNTKINDIVQAEKFVKENKDRLIEQYLARRDGKMYKFLERFYEKKTESTDVLRQSERNRTENHAVIIKKFIPFLKNEKISAFEQIKQATLAKFQDSLLTGGIKTTTARGKKITLKAVKPQSVNNDMQSVRKIFAYLARKGMITENIAERVKGLQVRADDRKTRGCYELERLNGAFNKKWKNEISCLLCMIIYTTGMRNSEIMRIRMEDMQTIECSRFITVKNNKTSNGVRFVPLHEVLYRKLAALAAKAGKKNELFDFLNLSHFRRANKDLAKILKASSSEIELENISFYSGRHFWKTLMSAEGLGEEVEEIMMGHKVVANVAKLYNHRDKRGKERLAKKARQVYEIIDRCIFNKTAKANLSRGA